MPENKIKYLSKDEVERFFEAIKNPRDQAVFALIYYYGLRVSEATLITLDDIDWCKEKIYIRRVKNGISGEKPLSPRIKEILTDYLAIRQPTGKALFTGRQGNLSCARIAQLFKEYAKEAGFPSCYSVHSLRHSIATHLLASGEGIEFVKDHLGHVNIQSTMIYAQLTDKKREEVFKRMEESEEVARF